MPLFSKVPLVFLSFRGNVSTMYQFRVSLRRLLMSWSIIINFDWRNDKIEGIEELWFIVNNHGKW